MAHGFEASSKDFEKQSLFCATAQATGCCALSVPACQQRLSQLVAVAVRESLERHVGVLRADLAKQLVAEPGKSGLEGEHICAELAGMRAELAEQGRRVRYLEAILLTPTGELRDSMEGVQAIGQRRSELDFRLQKLEDSVANLGPGGVASDGAISSTRPIENGLAERINDAESKSLDNCDVVMEAYAAKLERPQLSTSSSSIPDLRAHFTTSSLLRATQPATTWTRPPAPPWVPNSLTGMSSGVSSVLGTPTPYAGAISCDPGALVSPTLRQQVVPSYEPWPSTRPTIVQRSLSCSLPCLAASSRTGLTVVGAEVDGPFQSTSAKVSSPVSSLQHEKARPRSVARSPRVPTINTISPGDAGLFGAAGGDSSVQQPLPTLAQRPPTPGQTARAAMPSSARTGVATRNGAPRQSLSPDVR